MPAAVPISLHAAVPMHATVLSTAPMFTVLLPMVLTMVLTLPIVPSAAAMLGGCK
jgi:hypothetical protein